jgi:biopolymer transport protein ExbD
MRFRVERRVTPEINLTSLIDILFIVLLFLVLTTTFKESTWLRVSLPEATTAEPVQDTVPGPLRVTIDRSELIYVDDQLVRLADLTDRLRELAPTRDTKEVVLTADRKATHGRVIEVLDRIRRAGLYQLRIEAVEPAPP